MADKKDDPEKKKGDDPFYEVGANYQKAQADAFPKFLAAANGHLGRDFSALMASSMVVRLERATGIEIHRQPFPGTIEWARHTQTTKDQQLSPVYAALSPAEPWFTRPVAGLPPAYVELYQRELAAIAARSQQRAAASEDDLIDIDTTAIEVYVPALPENSVTKFRLVMKDALVLYEKPVEDKKTPAQPQGIPFTKPPNPHPAGTINIPGQGVLKVSFREAISCYLSELQAGIRDGDNWTQRRAATAWFINIQASIQRGPAVRLWNEVPELKKSKTLLDRHRLIAAEAGSK